MPCRIRLPDYPELSCRWWAVHRLLKKATARSGGTYLPHDILREALNGTVGIWFVEDETEDLVAVIVAGARQFPQRKVIQISFVAGRHLEEWWKEFVMVMDDLARKSGASAIYSYGRPGWIRFWKSRGIAMHASSEMLIREIK